MKRSAKSRKSAIETAESRLARARLLVKAGKYTAASDLLRPLVALGGSIGVRARRLLKAVEDKIRPTKSARRTPLSAKPAVRTPLSPRTTQSDELAVTTRHPSVSDSATYAGGLDSDNENAPAALPHRPRGGVTKKRVGRLARSSRQKKESPTALITPPSAPPTSLSPADVTVRRTPHMAISSDTPLAAAQEFAVDVYLDLGDPQLGEETEGVALHLRPDQSAVTLDVWLTASEHFELLDNAHRPLLLVVATPRSESVTFNLRVKAHHPKSGPGTIVAYFTFEGRPVGFVRRHLTLHAPSPLGHDEDAEDSEGNSAGVVELRSNDPRPDLMLQIVDPDRGGQHFTFQLWRDGALDSEGIWSLPSQSGEYVNMLLAEIERDRSERTIQGVGLQLYKAVPTEFGDAYWQLVDSGRQARSIMITSEEPHFPWELVRPQRALPSVAPDIHDALGVTCRVGRWVNTLSTNPPSHLLLDSSLVLAPLYGTPLAHTTQEVSAVMTVVPGYRVDPGTIEQLERSLEEHPPTLLHFAGHGNDGDNGAFAPSLQLDEGTPGLTIFNLAGLRTRSPGFARHPLVFLNACRAGRQHTSLSGIGGFAQVLLDAGAAAVIAPLWSVDDAIALEVATGLYEQLAGATAAGTSFVIADVLRAFRANAYAPTGSFDSYAAYCLFGDPNAVCSLSPSKPEA